MSRHQILDRESTRTIIDNHQEARIEAPRQFAGHVNDPERLLLILRGLGTVLQDSAAAEITDPATGKFFFIPGISAPGGSDVLR